MNDISKQLVRAMEQYTEEVNKEITSGIEQIGRNALSKVKASSPRGDRNRKNGLIKYYRGWKVDINRKNGSIGFVVHQGNKNYRLTHLLEFGHRTRNGRSRVKAQPHIRNVEEWAGAEAEKMIEKVVKG